MYIYIYIERERDHYISLIYVKVCLLARQLHAQGSLTAAGRQELQAIICVIIIIISRSSSSSSSS